MPYTQEELKKLSFYQNLLDEDEQQYLQNKATLELRANYPGSANQGALVRDSSDTILLFEEPYKNELLEDESSKIVHDLKVNKLKTDDSINQILNREFRKL